MAMTIAPSGRVIVAGQSKGMSDLGMGFGGPAGDSELFVSAFSPSGDSVFVRRFAATNVTCTEVETDHYGNIVLTGFFWGGPLQLGDTTLTPDDFEAAFVAKLAPDGEPLWAVSYGAPGDFAQGGGIAIADDGEIVSVGTQGS